MPSSNFKMALDVLVSFLGLFLVRVDVGEILAAVVFYLFMLFSYFW
jgi:hypothetical protein